MSEKKILVLDCEATIYEKGHPFSEPNRLMCIGLMDGVESHYVDIEYSGEPYGGNLLRLKQMVEEATLLIGFNIKYDLHWIRRYIPDIVFPRVWDCQLAEFLISNQTYVYPSLEQCSLTYSLPPKYTKIEDEYWKQGINTNQVPLEVLKERVLSDVIITHELYKAQKSQIEDSGKLKLFELQCDDLLVLQEMEFNGMLFDEQASNKLGEEAKEEIAKIEQTLKTIVPDDHINWNSNDHLSAILYGGGINYPSTETVYKTLKSGKIKQVERRCIATTIYPRLVDPLPGTETVDTRDLSDKDLELLNVRRSKERKSPIHRVYYTNEQVLRTLRVRGKAKDIVESNFRLSDLEKLSSTYYLGIPTLIKTMAWVGGIIHGSFNQTVARTGRLSSSKPNLQNFASVIKHLFRSRYAD